jgi:hypothetical protein
MTELAPLFVVGPMNSLTFFTAILCMYALIAHHHRPAFIISFATMIEPQLLHSFNLGIFFFQTVAAILSERMMMFTSLAVYWPLFC